MTRTVLLDFESRSTCDIELGGRAYWAHESTEAICCWLHVVETGEWILWLPGDPCPVRPDDLLVAHNMTGFDRYGVVALGWRATPLFPYVDTSELARTAGLPGALDELAKRWLGREKDHAGNAVTRRLSGIAAPLSKREKGVSATTDGPVTWGLTAAEIRVELERRLERSLPKAIKASDCEGLLHERLLWAVPPEVVAALKSYGGVGTPIPEVVYEYVIGYCRSDVEIMVEAWPRLKEWESADLPGVRDVDRAVNERGIAFDVALAHALLREDERGKREAAEALAAEMECDAADLVAAANSPAQFCEITGAENAQAATVAEMTHPLARLRERLASIASGKLTTALASLSPDGRLRDTLRYYAAHTGRWGGARFQPQNLPRPDKRFEAIVEARRIARGLPESEMGRLWDEFICELADHALAGGRLEQDEIDLLLRACLTASEGNALIFGDINAVEGRGLAWAADDFDALAVYTSGRDPYKVAAMLIYGCAYEDVQKWQRQIGKVAELALGYGGGKNAFARMAKAYGVDVSALDVDAIVAAWRAGRAPTQQWWRALQAAMISAYVDQRPAKAGRFVTFEPGQDGAIAMVLPSGRPIVYWGVKVEPGSFGPSITYDGGNFREHLYGGKLAENAVQGFCRDLLAEALVLLAKDGMAKVLHVHDEIVLDVPLADVERASKVLRSRLVTAPAWAPGLPLAASIDVGKRYRK